MKQVIALRTDLEMSTGKMIAQACHASLSSYRSASETAQNLWETEGAKKVAVGIEGANEVKERFKQAKANELPAYIVRDAGKTEVDQGTVTALGIGPAEDQTLDRITGDLTLL